MTADTGDERPRRRTTGAWMPGDPPGHRQFFTFATDRRFALERGAALTDVVVAYETWGTLDATASNAVLLCHAWTGDSHASRPGRSGPPRARAGGRRWSGRASRSTPTAGSSCARTCSAGARAAPGRRRRTPSTAGRTASRFPVITIRDMVRAQARLADHLGDRPLARRRRRLDGRDAGARVGDHVPASACARSCRSPRACRRPPSRSRGERSGGGRSRLDPRWRGGDYYDAGRRRARRTAWRSPGWSPR